MSEFKASNGWHIDKAGNVCTPSGVVVITGGESEHVAKFFQELRDHELGRWRSKEDPSWTAVRDGEFVCFQNEDGKRSFSVNADETTDYRWTGDLIEIAREYFAAHPQHKPLPTKPGLYVGASLHAHLESARVFRLRWDGDWGDTGDRECDPEKVRALVQEIHDNEGLVRLVPEGGDDE